MGIRTFYVAVSVGIVIGIVTAWAVADPRLTALVLIACLAILLVAAIGTAMQARRRKKAKDLFDLRAELGDELRTRVFGEPVTLPDDEDRKLWSGEFQTWDTATQEVIHEHADDWHQVYVRIRPMIGAYPGIPAHRSEVVMRIDAKLSALAEIRTKL